MDTDYQQALNDAGPIPDLQGTLRAHNVKLPHEAQQARGVRVLGRMIRSLVFTTDIAIIRNCDADAVFAVYPFTPQQMISKMLVEASSIPVFVGVGGGTTSGPRSGMLARDAEAAGAYGVVLNAPASNATLEMVSRVVDIPVVVTVVDDDPQTVRNRLESGASIINVAAGKRMPEVVASLRRQFPQLPLFATGGKTPDTVAQTVDAGTNAVIVTPPSTSELFTPLMDRYRDSTGSAAPRTGPRPISQAALSEIEHGLRKLKEDGLILK